ncbi:DUF1286 domain-containing protein [Sulfolobus tengchongensis]|uniref:DUF1286 domain-containing protein n=1 Tax=Sulfolobus tengchongensis TaxID=207809 RepID=A0AAX4L1Q3_9CREN
MKLRTHYIFSVGLISIILALTFNLSFFTNLFISFYTSFLGNTIIDRLGHEMKWSKHGYIPTRTPLTHTVLRSIMWGLVSVLTLLLLFYDYYHYTLILPIIISGIIVGPSHMLLDVFTESGIYTKKNGKWIRIALAHFSYNNVFVNGVSSLIGILLLFLSYSLSIH